MTRKDFELIASVLANMGRDEKQGFGTTHAEIVNEFALALRSTNPRFDAARFREACQEYNAQ